MLNDKPIIILPTIASENEWIDYAKAKINNACPINTNIGIIIRPTNNPILSINCPANNIQIIFDKYAVENNKLYFRS